MSSRAAQLSRGHPVLVVLRGSVEGPRGQYAAYNADAVRRLMGNEVGPVRDAVVLNAGAALAAHAVGCGPLEEQLAAEMARANESLDSGSTEHVLGRWLAATGRGCRQSGGSTQSFNEHVECDIYGVQAWLPLGPRVVRVED